MWRYLYDPNATNASGTLPNAGRRYRAKYHRPGPAAEAGRECGPAGCGGGGFSRASASCKPTLANRSARERERETTREHGTLCCSCDRQSRPTTSRRMISFGSVMRRASSNSMRALRLSTSALHQTEHDQTRSIARARSLARQGATHVSAPSPPLRPRKTRVTRKMSRYNRIASARKLCAIDTKLTQLAPQTRKHARKQARNESEQPSE